MIDFNKTRDIFTDYNKNYYVFYKENYYNEFTEKLWLQKYKRRQH